MRNQPDQQFVAVLDCLRNRITIHKYIFTWATPPYYQREIEKRKKLKCPDEPKADIQDVFLWAVIVTGRGTRILWAT